MNKDVAQELWSFANNRREKEFRKWCALPARTSDRENEAQRQKVADWASVSNLFYKIYIGEIHVNSDFKDGFQRSENTQRHTTKASENLPGVQGQSEDGSGESLSDGGSTQPGVA